MSDASKSWMEGFDEHVGVDQARSLSTNAYKDEAREPSRDV